MTYSAEISRSNPSCYLFLVDQSGSMADKVPNGGGSKAESVATIINRTLFELTIKCAKSEGIRDYFDVGVIGYGARVGTVLGGQLAGRPLVSISDIGNFPARIEERTRKEDDGAGGLLERQIKFPVWLDPVANGSTPMCQGLDEALAILSPWVTQHAESFPPTIIHITDGESTDGDPSANAQRITGLQTNDGQCLLFNIHISSSNAQPIEFPDNESLLPDDFARLLFRMSSLLPPSLMREAANEGISTSDGTRGFSFNADMVSLIKFLDIGTRPSNLR